MFFGAPDPVQRSGGRQGRRRVPATRDTCWAWVVAGFTDSPASSSDSAPPFGAARLIRFRVVGLAQVTYTYRPLTEERVPIVAGMPDAGTRALAGLFGYIDYIIVQALRFTQPVDVPAGVNPLSLAAPLHFSSCCASAVVQDFGDRRV